MNTVKKVLLTFSLFFTTSLIYSQSTSLSGSVVDVSGSPLPGVNVVEKGTANGAVTDFDGNYSITVTAPDAILMFTSIGFATLEIAVGNQTNIDVVMEEDASALDEVVVVGYGTQRKQDLTGAVASVDLEQFEDAPNTSILQSLQGSLAGVTIGQVSATGAEPDIQVRGQSTLNGNQSPLIVLDGIIYRGRLADLNPKDIKSVDVLKDPSSKAIYGAQAANGIVLVTTNSGKSKRKPVISYSTFYAVQTPIVARRTLNSEQYLIAARDVVWQNGYLGPNFTQPNPEWTPATNGSFFPELIAGIENGTDYDWFGENTGPGFTQDHQLSVSGGSEMTSYYISAGLTGQEGWVVNDNYDRQTVRVNLDTKIKDWLTIGTNLFGSFSDFSGRSPTLSTLGSMSPVVTPTDENGELVTNPLGNASLNPLLKSTADNRDNLNNISAIFYASIDIPQIKGLNFRVNYSNNYRWTLDANSNIFDAGLTGAAYKRNSSTHDVLLDNILTYNRRFGADEQHGFDATLVAGFNTIDFESTMSEGIGFANLDLSYNSLEQATIQRISSEAWEERFIAQTARINYDYKRKYLLNASLRRDGFSGFSENNKTALFPSLGLGWIVSEEDFFGDDSAINLLKFRGSYGENGNLTSRYSSLARIEANEESLYIFGDGGTTVIGQSVESLSNPDLKWERTNGINIGADFGIWDNKISGSVDYYQSTTNDLLWNFILPQLSGFSTIRSNIGEIENTGIEVLLNFNPIRTSDLNWDIGINFSSNQNKINTLLGIDRDGDGQEDDLIANGLFIGESIGTIFNYEVEGIYQIGDDDIPDGWTPGQQRLRDLDGDGSITPEGDRKILGREEPAYQFGISNSLRYKDFSFRFFINSIQGGNNSFLGANNANFGNTIGNAQSENRFADLDYWSPNNPDARYRNAGIDAPITAGRFFDRSFIRLQDISLAYNLNPKVLDKIGLQGLKIFVSGKNLVTLTDWQGWDPETGQGISNGLPVMKSYTLGLNVSF